MALLEKSPCCVILSVVGWDEIGRTMNEWREAEMTVYEYPNLDMVPVLHRQSIHLVNNQDLNRG